MQEKTAMRKILSIILALLMLLGLAPLGGAAEAPEGFNTQTIMVYIVGSDLEPKGNYATTDITEMMRSGLDTDKVTVLLMTGGTTSWGNNIVPADKLSIYRLTGRNIELVHQEPKRNMADPGPLVDFLNYAVANYPAESYALTLWNHGGGPMVGFGMDEYHMPDMLTLLEMRDALKSSPFNGDNRLEWLLFDACLMATLEVGMLLAPHAKYMLASEEVLPALGVDFRFLGQMGKTSMRGDEVGRLIIDMTEEYYADVWLRVPDFNMSVTLSLLDLDKLQPVAQAVDNLFFDLRHGFEMKVYSDVARSRDATKTYGATETTSDYDLVDLHDLARNLSGLYPQETAALRKAIDEAVLHNISNIPRSEGLAIYFPFSNKKVYELAWRDLYRQFDIMPNYQAFMDRFGAILLGDSLSSWKGEDAPVVVFDEVTGEYAIQLSPEQVANYDRAEYYILTHRTGEEYTLAFMSSDVSLSEEGRLQANFGGNILYIGDRDSGLVPVPFLRETENLDGIAKYQIPIVLERRKQDGSRESLTANLLAELDKQQGLARINGAIMDDDGSMVGKRDINLADWDVVHLVYLSSYVTRDETGKPLVVGDWVVSDDITILSLDIRKGLQLGYQPLDREAYDHALMISVVDTQGNAYPSDVMPLSDMNAPPVPPPASNPVRDVEYAYQNQQPTLLTEAEDILFTLEMIDFSAEDTGDARRAPDTMLLKLLMENRQEEDVNITLAWLNINGTMIPVQMNSHLPAGTMAQAELVIPVAPGPDGSSLVDLGIREITEMAFRFVIHKHSESMFDPGSYTDEIRLHTQIPVGAGYEGQESKPKDMRTLAELDGVIIEQTGPVTWRDGQLRVPLLITNNSERFDQVRIAESSINGIMAQLELAQHAVVKGSRMYTYAFINQAPMELPADLEPYRSLLETGDNLERLGIFQVKDISLRFELDHHSRANSLGRERVAKKTPYVHIPGDGMLDVEQPLDTAGSILADEQGLLLVRLDSDPSGKRLYLKNDTDKTIRLISFHHVWVDDAPYGANAPIRLVLAPGASAYHQLFSYLPGIEPEGQELRFLLSVLDLDSNKLLFRTDDIKLTLH